MPIGGVDGPYPWTVSILNNPVTLDFSFVNFRIVAVISAVPRDNEGGV
jgi:hypothetical protein